MSQDDPKPSDPPKTPAALKPEVVQALYSGPAPYINRIYSTPLPFGFRLTFMEQDHEQREYYRSAAFLSLADAWNLVELLRSQLDAAGFVPPTAGPTEPGAN